MEHQSEPKSEDFPVHRIEKRLFLFDKCPDDIILFLEQAAISLAQPGLLGQQDLKLQPCGTLMFPQGFFVPEKEEQWIEMGKRVL